VICHIIDTEYFKLDGGAMFGVVPKSLWNRLNPADDDNMCTWSLRCMLIEDGDKRILIDTGMGYKQSDKFFHHFKLHGEATLLHSLSNLGYEPADITDVLLTHLHFDHCGGAVKKDVKGLLVPTFPNARYWSHETHYKSACQPNARERASFLKENFIPLEESGQLFFLRGEEDHSLSDSISYIVSNGHTSHMMSPVLHGCSFARQSLQALSGDDKSALSDPHTLVYCADLMPSTWHIHMPYVMAYDIEPLVTLEEKKIFLDRCIADDLWLFYEHDPVTVMSKVSCSERGRYGASKLVTV